MRRSYANILCDTDGWGYEVEVVGRVRASPKEIKAMTEVGKAKAEKFKGEIKEEL